MEAAISSWIVPFTFIPGVGMLVLSTANRFHNVNELIRSLAREGDPPGHLPAMYGRTKRLNRALVAFYLALAAFALAALSSNMALWAEVLALRVIADILITLGVTTVVFGASQLIVESMLAFRTAEVVCKEATSPGDA
ncbi:MAG: DUF2721 domain-containing protein [Pseudomonadota bacterium]